MKNRIRLVFAWALLVPFLNSARAAAQAPGAEKGAFFENQIRPLLAEHCVKCHGPKKAESGLRVDLRSHLLKGGDSGPGIVPGSPEKSLIVKALRHVDDLAMPPKGKLPAALIEAVERWIRDGAVWPESVKMGAGGPALRSGPATQEELTHWSLKTVAKPTVPKVAAARPGNNEIDAFLQKRLAQDGLTLRSPADKRTLLRRVTFDLTGLPPSQTDVEEYLRDSSPQAFDKVVERLLASKAYGERWGRHWLDVVRYADTAGETADYPTPFAYKYRNWVIQAFNADMPYDEFLRQQLAGDLLADEILPKAGAPSDEILARYREMRVATGFIAISRRFGFDVENYHHLTIQDTIDTVGQVVLGLSLGCARCHDHKYDPVDMPDYYAWYGIFENTRYSFPGSEEKKRPYDLFPVLPAKIVADRKSQFEKQLAGLEMEVKKLETEIKAQGEKPEIRQRLKDVQSRRDAHKKQGPFLTSELTYAAIDREQITDTRVQLRGEKTKLGDLVPRRNLGFLGGERVPKDAGSGRKQLAEWLTRRSNPLTARVMVNRIWQHHFGRGLVATENDFGTRGQTPSHPELLDWLASRFMDQGWSLKAMHRLIVASAAYQQASDEDPRAIQLDPDARLLWRFNRRRLSAEELRDALLFVSGDLDPTMGGEHPFPPVDSWGFTQHSPYYGVYPTNRRSVYLMQQRLKRHPFLALFDGADPNASTARREMTTVPTQALFLMNNEFVHERANSWVKRWLTPAEPTDAQIDGLYQAALSRPATTEELAESRAFVQSYQSALAKTSGPGARNQAWAAFLRTLLTRNEFLFVD